MAESNCSEAHRACRNGDMDNVRRLFSDATTIKQREPNVSSRSHATSRSDDREIARLRVTSIINRLEPNGSSCLHAASSSGHKEIVRFLLEHGASRQIRDKDDRTPADVAQTEEIAKLFDRPAEEVFQRYAEAKTPDKPPPDWLFGQDIAEAFSRAIQWGCVKDRGMKKTMKKIDEANLIPDNDESKEGKLLRFYFNEARETNDPTFLLRAYTINGPFYKFFNEYMATGSSKEVYENLCHGWSGYYTGTIMKNPALDPYRFAGTTYRGMVINREDLKQYKRGVVLTNKAFQSTSKLPKVALTFATIREPTLGQVSVLIQYTICYRKSALDIRNLSEFPEEEEVLMVPGCLFKVDSINENVQPWQIFVREIECPRG